MPSKACNKIQLISCSMCIDSNKDGVIVVEVIVVGVHMPQKIDTFVTVAVKSRLTAILILHANWFTISSAFVVVHDCQLILHYCSTLLALSSMQIIPANHNLVQCNQD